MKVMSVQHSMHLFWEVTEFMANTLVFFVFGVIIAERIYVGYNPADGSEALLKVEDWGWAVLNWVLLNAIRFVTLVICKPFMTWTSAEEFTWIDVIVATWAGLRGAVGLSLALIVYLTSAAPDSKIDVKCASSPVRSSSVRFYYPF
jgi:NhaP-type Na+/H+ or K+/H+ antiporter